MSAHTTMEIRLFANLGEQVDSRVVTLPVEEEVTVGEILDRLFEHYPSLRDDILADDGKPADHINFLVNGSTIESRDGELTHPIGPTDELAIFPPVSGGS